MEEKIYKIMRGAGALNIVLGVISLVVGIAAGVLLIISGGKLVSGKSRILFWLENSMRKKNYIFTNKKHSNRAIMSTILGGISLVSLGIVTYLSYSQGGVMHGGYGVTGVLATIYSLIGLILGILTLREKDIYRIFPVLGTILNVVALGGVSFLLYLGSRL